MKAVLTGGGTGGHIYPALSIAESLIASGWEVLYIGSRDGLEGKIVPDAGIQYEDVTAHPLPRKITPAIFTSLLKTTAGLFQAISIIKDFDPDIVVGTGGFVAGPVVLAAHLNGRLTIIQEQNVYPGFTNRLLARFADKIALNFSDAGEHFPAKTRSRLRVTGNPIRKEILSTTREEGLNNLGLKPDKNTLLVFGGSQGSMSINRSMLDVYNYYKDSSSMQIIHITGKNNYDTILDKLHDNGIDPDKYDKYRIKPYLNNMEWAYAVADLIIYRAGATGIAEITARGIPAVLIPYPYSAGNHQEYNARNLEKHGAAVVIDDDKLEGRVLIEQIETLFNDKERLAGMGLESKKLGQPEAREKLISLIEEVASAR